MLDKSVAKSTTNQLADENAKLRARLNEAEETLRAIRSGEIDALVLSTAEGDNILDLKGVQEPYRVMVESMNDGAVTLALDGTILYSNRRFADWVKVPLRQIVGQPLQGVLAGQDREGLGAMLARGAKGIIREALTLQATDGTQTPALFSMFPLPQGEGKAISVVITDLSAVAAAAKARLRLALIVESSDDAIISTTLGGRVESWNKAAEKLYGYTAGEAVGQTVHSLIVPPEYLNEVRAELSTISQGEGTRLADTVRQRKDGTRIAVSLNTSPMLDDTGEVIGASIIARDISESKCLEEERDRAANLLGERLKEIGCLYATATILADSKLSDEQRMQRIVETLPQAFRYPEVSCACLSLRGRQYWSGDCQPTPWRLTTPIVLAGEEIGELKISYTKERPASDEGSFLREERTLIDTIARMVVDYLWLGQAISQLQQFRDLLDDSNDSVIVSDSGTARIVDVNKRACASLGYSRDELLRMKIMDIDHAVASKSAWDSAVNAVKTAGAMLIEVEYRRKDGSTFPAEISVKHVPREGSDYVIAIARDITERKQAEEILRRREAEFRSLAESMPQIVWITRPDGWTTYFNQQWMDYTGLTLEESLGHGWNKPFHPDDQKQAWDAWQNAVKNLDTYSIESRLQGADGGYRWWLTRGVPVKDDNGNVLQWFGTCTDIHDLKMAGLEVTRTNNELRESERRFSDVLGNVQLVSIMLDRDSRITYCNDYLLRLTGWKREEVMGKNWWDIFVPPDLSYLEDTLFTSLLNEQPEASHFENDIITRSGERRLIRWNNSVLHSATGEVTGIATIGEDITDSEKAAASIKYLNRVYAMLSAIDTLIVHAHDSHELFEEACRIAVEIGGFPMAMIGTVNCNSMEITDMVVLGKDKSLANAIKKIASSDGLANSTVLAPAIKEKRTIVFNDLQNDPHVLFGKEYARLNIRSAVVLPLFSADEAIGALTLFADTDNIFEREELELLNKLAEDIAFAMGNLEAQEALRQFTEELEDKVAARTADLERARQESDQANKAKSVFLASMSHEIRTPMNGVVGMIDVLRQTRLMDHQLEMVDLISESAFSLLGIIEDILNFSKIEAGKLEVERVPMPLAEVVEGACNLLGHVATRRGVELTTFIDPAIPEEVLGDALRLRQVLVNLINNALKFSSGQPRQGRVSLRALLVGHDSDQVSVEFQVIDNGIGMDERTQARLFTAFSQADSATTRHFGGTGLGLVISHNLVKLMGGEITAQSAPDKGSTFTVRLPFTALPAKPLDDSKCFDLAGLSCVVLGEQGFDDDLAAYLTHAGAIVERSKDLAAATNLIGTIAPGLWLFIIDAKGDAKPVEKLRTACLARDNHLDARFVVIEPGCHQPGIDFHLTMANRESSSPERIQAVDLVSVGAHVMHRRLFLEAVAIATGRSQTIKENALSAVETESKKAPSRERARQQGRLILVAEDNEVSQKVILHQLKLLGFAADVTDDGREAMERWKSGDYGLLLTDLHMPIMDGYQLTTAIRAEEVGMQRIPIIALTANALTGEAEHCRATGMDDYLSKPARLKDLGDILEKWLPDVADSNAYAPDSQAAPARSAGPVDVGILASRVGDDPLVIHKILQIFQTDTAEIATELLAACIAGDAAVVGAVAHKLKASAFSVGAQGLGELCVKMEQASKGGQIDAMQALRSSFEAEVADVNEFLEHFDAR